MSLRLRLRREVASYARELHSRGWVANHDGNVSARDGAGFIISPTGVSKRKVEADGLALCDASGAPVEGGKPPSEVGLHVGAYRARSELTAVIHAHPPYASAFALAGRRIEPIAMPEVVVSLGPTIPLLPVFAPRDPAAVDAVEAALRGADVVLLGGNGVLAAGPDLETAYLRVELVEHYARILGLCQGGVGPVASLDEAMTRRLVELRRAAGLVTPDVADPRSAGGDAGLERVVAEEVRRALGRKD